MMFRCVIFTAVVYLASIIKPGDGSRILCIIPTQSISHQVVYQALTLALHKRGHELVIVTPDPINDSTMANYTEIDVRFDYGTLGRIKYIEARRKLRWIDWITQLDVHFLDLTEKILSHPELRKLYVPNSNEKFDLMIVELIHWQAVYPLATRFDIPMIGISSLALNMHNQYTIGNPIMTSHLSNWELETELSDQLSFWQRLKNFVIMWNHLRWWQTTFVPAHEEIARKYFGNDIPDLSDIAKNVSLIFVNEQTPISYPKPNNPKIIEIGGFHLSKKSTDLPKDLKKFLDEATEGVVYMSLGSNAKSNMLSKETLNEFITTFSRLPYKVLWKFEEDVLRDKPDNIYIMKWIPQQAVLAHPNLKVFIYQGGVQSTEEAVHYAVPLIGFPVLWDQDMQVNKMVSLGVAKKLEISAVDGKELYEAITTVASDTRYKQRMLDLRSLINDKPYDPLENAVWWTEHVIRHKGAPHLQSTIADEPWYRRQDMDVVAFISAGLVIVCGLILVILYKLVRSIYVGCGSTEGSLDWKKTN